MVSIAEYENPSHMMAKFGHTWLEVYRKERAHMFENFQLTYYEKYAARRPLWWALVCARLYLGRYRMFSDTHAKFRLPLIEEAALCYALEQQHKNPRGWIGDSVNLLHASSGLRFYLNDGFSHISLPSNVRLRARTVKAAIRLRRRIVDGEQKSLHSIIAAIEHP